MFPSLKQPNENITLLKSVIGILNTYLRYFLRHYRLLLSVLHLFLLPNYFHVYTYFSLDIIPVKMKSWYFHSYNKNLREIT